MLKDKVIPAVHDLTSDLKTVSFAIIYVALLYISACTHIKGSNSK